MSKARKLHKETAPRNLSTSDPDKPQLQLNQPQLQATDASLVLADDGLWMQDLDIWADLPAPPTNVRDATDLQFLVNGCDVSSVPAATYSAVLPFAYFPSLKAVAVEFPLDVSLGSRSLAPGFLILQALITRSRIVGPRGAALIPRIRNASAINFVYARSILTAHLLYIIFRCCTLFFLFIYVSGWGWVNLPGI